MTSRLSLEQARFVVLIVTLQQQRRANFDDTFSDLQIRQVAAKLSTGLQNSEHLGKLSSEVEPLPAEQKQLVRTWGQSMFTCL